MPTNISNTIVQGTNGTSGLNLAANDTLNLLTTGFILAYGDGSNGVSAVGPGVFNLAGTIISTQAAGISVGFGGNTFNIGATATVFGLDIGISVAGGINTFANAGDIGALNFAVSFSGGQTTFGNSGNIIAANGDAVTLGGNTNIFTNTGYISGGTNGHGVQFTGGGNSMFNSGTIFGTTGGINSDGTTGVNALFNTGSISAGNVLFAFAYSGSNAQDNIINNGSIVGQFGAVDLQGGNDVYDGRGGTAVGAILAGDGNDIIYGGNGSETIQGGNDNDQIYGGGGADLLFGEAGNDLIVGGPGADVLRGGLGTDLFVFSFGDNGDLIQGFNEGGVRDGFDLRPFFDATGFTGADPRAAGIMQVLQNGANTDVYLYGTFAFRIEGVVAAALDNSYFLIQ